VTKYDVTFVTKWGSNPQPIPRSYATVHRCKQFLAPAVYSCELFEKIKLWLKQKMDVETR